MRIDNHCGAKKAFIFGRPLTFMRNVGTTPSSGRRTTLPLKKLTGKYPPVMKSPKPISCSIFSMKQPRARAFSFGLSLCFVDDQYWLKPMAALRIVLKFIAIDELAENIDLCCCVCGTPL
jgi:hypothetical protein